MQTSADFCVIGRDVETREVVRIGNLERRNHWHIIGGTGSGKTTHAIQTFLQDVAHGHGGLFITPDPDGIRDIIARLPPARLDAVVLIDPSDALFPYGSNQLVCPNRQSEQAVKDAHDRMMHVFRKLWGPGSRDPSWGPQLENVLSHCLYALILNDLTLSELPYLLRDEQIRGIVVSYISRAIPASPDAFRWTRWFFENDFNTWPERLQLERTDSTLNKVLRFLTDPRIENIVGQKTSTIHLRQWMEQRKIILVSLSEQALGEEAVRLLGTMILAQVKDAVFSREQMDKSQRMFFPVFCDEFELFAGDDFKTLLERGRKHNVPFALTHQDMAQLADESLREAVDQTGNKTTFLVTPADAKHFAPLYAKPPKAEELQEIKTEEVVGMKPVRAYRRDVIGHLLWQGHEDERVMSFVKDYLRELHLALPKRIQEERHDEYLAYREHMPSEALMGENLSITPSRYGRTVRWTETVYPRNHLGIEYDPETIPRIFADLNSWLFEGMRDRDALWQALPGATYGRLAHFFGFEQIYDVWYGLQGTVEECWQEFQAKDFLAKEAQYSGLNRNRLFNAAIAAIEAAFLHFLCSLFPSPSKASIREGWRQSRLAVGVPSSTSPRVRFHIAYEQIITTLLQETNHHPTLDVTTYVRRFLAELSQPQLAVEVLLPVLHASYQGVQAYITEGEYKAWRTVRKIDTRLSYEAHRILRPRYGFVSVPGHRPQMALWYTYHLEMFTDNIFLPLIEAMQKYVEPFLTWLRFYAHLHCAQLALSRQPIMTMDSGQYEPDKRTMTHYILRPKQTPSEMAGLMEQELASLEPFTAWCRIQNLRAPEGRRIAKHKVRIPRLQPGVTGRTLDKRIERIRDQSRLLCAPRTSAAVKGEIRGRVAHLRQLTTARGGAPAVLPGTQAFVVPEEREQKPKRQRSGPKPE